MISVLFIWLFFSSQHLLLDSLGVLQAIRQGKHSELHSLTAACCWKKLNISVIELIYFPNPLTPFQGRQGGEDLSQNALGWSKTSNIGTWVSKPVMLYSQWLSFSQNSVSLLFLFPCTFTDFNFIQIKKYLIAIVSNCNLKRKDLRRKLFKLQSKTKNVKQYNYFFFSKSCILKGFVENYFLKYWKWRVFSSSLVVKKGQEDIPHLFWSN